MQVVLQLPSGESVILPAADWTLGREGNGLRMISSVGDERRAPLPAPIAQTLSREHARIRLWRGNLYVEDRYSANGTFLNGIPLRPLQPAVLESGDRLRLGALQLQIALGD